MWAVHSKIYILYIYNIYIYVYNHILRKEFDLISENIRVRFQEILCCQPEGAGIVCIQGKIIKELWNSSVDKISFMLSNSRIWMIKEIWEMVGLLQICSDIPQPPSLVRVIYFVYTIEECAMLSCCKYSPWNQLTHIPLEPTNTYSLGAN